MIALRADRHPDGTGPPLRAAAAASARVLARLCLGGEIVLTYGFVRWAMWRRGLPGTLAALRSPSRIHRRLPWDRRCRPDLGSAVIRTLEPLPVDSRCLMRSLVLTGLLARRGIVTELVISVGSGNSFGAHSWVEAGGRPLLPADVPDFERLLTL